MSEADASPPFAAYGRDELRRSYADAWRKHLARSPLTSLEALIADVLVLHPEYQALAASAPAALAFEPRSDAARENPFLHMGLHLAVREQLMVDRPPGVRAVFESLKTRIGDVHGAEHALMESLAETLWEAQRGGRPPDEGRYLEIARHRVRAERPARSEG
jgi:hypothetical protein